MITFFQILLFLLAIGVGLLVWWKLDFSWWGIVVVVFLVSLASAGSYGLDILRGPASVPGKILNGDRILSTYEQFFNQYATIQAYEQQIPQAQSAVDQFKVDHFGNLDTYVNSTELSRLNSVLLGLRNMRAQAVAQYNANAANDTRGIFKDGELPQLLAVQNDKIINVK